MEKQKEEKLKYAIAMEKHMVDMQEKEAHSRINSVNNRQKLLDDLAQDGKKLDAEVLALQENRDREREILFNRLHSGWFYIQPQVNNIMVIYIFLSSLSK